ERAGRRPGGGGGRVDGRGDLPRREDPAPRVTQVRGHARHERPGGGVGCDAGGRGAVEGATWHRVSAAGGCVGDDQPGAHAAPGARARSATAGLRATSGSGAVPAADPRAGGGRRPPWLDAEGWGRRAVVWTAEAVVAGLLLIGHPREP